MIGIREKKRFIEKLEIIEKVEKLIICSLKIAIKKCEYN